MHDLGFSDQNGDGGVSGDSDNESVGNIGSGV